MAQFDAPNCVIYAVGSQDGAPVVFFKTHDEEYWCIPTDQATVDRLHQELHLKLISE